MRHRYECPLRWADMDQLRHINNVKYADYLQEARIDFFRALQLRVMSDAASQESYGIVVVRHEITYLAPLRFDYRPVSVEIWVTEVRAASFTVGYDVFREQPDGTRTVFLRATTRLAPFVFGSSRPRRLTEGERSALTPYVEQAAPRETRRPAAARLDDMGRYPVAVRFSDLDPYGHVNNVTYLEYFQEGRIAYNGRLWSDLPEDTPHVNVVVAQADFDYLRPMVAAAAPYDLWTWVGRVGNRSAVMDAEIRQGETVMARSSVVLVFFDSESDRSTEPPAAYRDRLVAALAT